MAEAPFFIACTNCTYGPAVQPRLVPCPRVVCRTNLCGKVRHDTALRPTVWRHAPQPGGCVGPAAVLSRLGMSSRQLALFPPEPAHTGHLPEDAAYARLVSIDPTRNRFRFYVLARQRTLWDEWAISTTWGRIGSVGQSRVAYYENRDKLAEGFARLLRKRLARGYRVVAVGRGTRAGAANGS